MKSISYSLIAAAAAVGMAFGADTATTNPVGYTTVSCLPNSDTIVGLPLRISATGASALSAPVAVNGASATLSVTGTPFAASAFTGTHYAKITSGTNTGKWFAITGNTANSVTVDLNGATLSATTNDKFEIIKFWTLAELINPATATTDPATTPNAVVASLNAAGNGRRTEILLPDLLTPGVNLSPAATFYVTGGEWRKSGEAGNFNTYQLWPDTYFIVRNPSAVTSATKYIASGEVDTSKFTVSLATQALERQDNFVALPRAVDIKLNELGLANTSAFVSSTGTAQNARQDEILVFDNTSAARNRAPSATYYYLAAGATPGWRKVGSGADAGEDVIKGGSGLIIRKQKNNTGNTANWENTPNY